jgi:FtsP/CotA-like multicopper oxidase with cupredoxin domain
LIVEGNRVPTPTTPGDIDTILKDATGAALPERVVLLEQIQYACRDADGKIKTKTDSQGNVIAWVCDPGDVGTIEGVDGGPIGYDQFGPGSWQESGRFTSINGDIQPVFQNAVVGQVERWRLIHAGVRETISLAFVKAKEDTQPITHAQGPAQQLWLQEHCNTTAPIEGEADPALVQWEFATDGQTNDHMTGIKTNILQPGYRSDILAVFPEPGLYCMIDRSAAGASSINGQVEGTRLLGFVQVVGKKGAVPGTAEQIITKVLVNAASALPADVRPQVVADLQDGLKTPKFAPHPTITADELTGSQDLVFSIETVGSETLFQVNGKSFDGSVIDRTLPLGGVEQWDLTASTNIPGATISHPFHIHVNPFQIVKILDPEGRDVTDTSVPRATRLAWEGGDAQYLDMKEMWRDTVFVKMGYHVIMRTRYERYIGDFVLHCHILDHEDQGMMQLIQIAIPSENGGHGAHSSH